MGMNHTAPADTLVARIAATLEARGRFDPAAHLRLLMDGLHVGWLARRHVPVLRTHDGILGDEHDGGVTLLPGVSGFEARNAALATLARSLADAGEVRGWRNELFAITPSLEAPALAVIERAAARYLGLLTFASHMNGIIAGERRLWISRRSAAKAVDPGMWDNLVAGGMPHGSDPLETLVRECEEESGIPPGLARSAELHGVTEVLREIPRGVQWERIYLYDLIVPAGFVPVNRDGEVAEHRQIEPAELLAIMAAGAMTVDATLVTLDALRRRGWTGDPAPTAPVVPKAP